MQTQQDSEVWKFLPRIPRSDGSVEIGAMVDGWPLSDENMANGLVPEGEESQNVSSGHRIGVDGTLGATLEDGVLQQDESHPPPLRAIGKFASIDLDHLLRAVHGQDNGGFANQALTLIVRVLSTLQGSSTAMADISMCLRIGPIVEVASRAAPRLLGDHGVHHGDVGRMLFRDEPHHLAETAGCDLRFGAGRENDDVLQGGQHHFMFASIAGVFPVWGKAGHRQATIAVIRR
mmetsp:Transcript_46347/g.99259  ORF Transcript_46347/g.99259 Transcript_46347/m.99259 type:complete len:233 (-) Transcript_46347:476-1174(-)